MIKNKKETVTVWVCKKCHHRVTSEETKGFNPTRCLKCFHDEFSLAIIPKSPEVITK